MSSQRILAHVLLGAVGTLAIGAADAQAQALPTPKELVSGLDLECYRTPGPSLDLQLTLSHLNPVLLALGLQPHQVIMRELVQTCVPVRKNTAWPTASALPYIEHIDFACYRLDAAPLANPLPINLTHLNPVLANLPQHNVVLQKPAQLCVPVAKNNVLPPDQILAAVKYLDVECYDTAPDPHPQFSLVLSQLNPQLQNIAPHGMTLDSEPRKLCVPVRKNNQIIPAEVLDRIRWVDLEKFRANPTVMIAPTNVLLRHINPLLANLPAVPVVLQEAVSLLVPVAKNGAIPPSD